MEILEFNFMLAMRWNVFPLDLKKRAQPSYLEIHKKKVRDKRKLANLYRFLAQSYRKHLMQTLPYISSGQPKRTLSEVS